MDGEDDLGKLKAILKERCENCGTHLQVRTQGESYFGNRYFSMDELVCPTCKTALPLKPEKRRAKRNLDTPWD
jgi:hypothetical protein